MIKTVYCANCGTRLNVSRKALPKYGKIIDIVEYHECPEDFVELELTQIDVPKFSEVEGKNEFVQNLNDLNPTDSRNPEHTISDLKLTTQPQNDLITRIKSNLNLG